MKLEEHCKLTGVIGVNDPILQIYLGEINNAKRGKGSPRRKEKGTVYKDAIIAFDIETTRIKKIEQSVMYVWAVQLDDLCTIVGRTWDEFLQLLDLMKTYSNGEKYVIWVHNLSYEFQYLAGIYHFQPEEVFCTDPRKILKCTMMDTFEFRCSYYHSNMSLAQYLKKWGVEAQKVEGFDYKKERFYFTKLTDFELQYQINDVKGLVQALKAEMAFEGDTLYSIPMTSTGFVRRDMKRAMRTYNRTTFSRQLPDMGIYRMLYDAFRGGNTHANRYFSDILIGYDDHPYKVYSMDRSSSYPDCQCNDLFPVGRWSWELPEFLTAERLHELMDVRHKALLIDVTFTNMRLADPDWGAPYISISKCYNLVPAARVGCFDNGRVLAASSCSMILTDIDFRIIMEEYVSDHMIIHRMASSTYGRLPAQFTDTVKSYYIKKTELKGVEGQEYYYDRSKNRLNSCYGMSVQNPVKTSILFKDGDPNGDYLPDLSVTAEELLNKANDKAFIQYAWGVWTTAWARYRLEEGIRIVHHPEEGCYFVYTDTDSVKFFCDNKDAYRRCMQRWKLYNQQRQKSSKASGAFAKDPAGVTHYMGVYELDGVYESFVTLGAKKYAYESINKKGKKELHITVAGVVKDKGAAELAKKGGIRKFKDGFIFKEAGGTESIYNDHPEITEITIQGHQIPITRNVVIRDSTYQIGLTAEYLYILEHPEIYNKLFDKDLGYVL